MYRWLLLLLIAALATAEPASGQWATSTVPTPESHFGFVPGTDRQLADWSELSAYYEKVAVASPRVAIDTLGLSTRGLPMVMLTITSPGNQLRLPELREIQYRLADPRTIETEDQRADLLEAARTIVLVTSHIHSTEVGAGQMPANLLHRLATSDDPDVLEILDAVVLLLIPSLNPDGTELIANWYRRNRGTPFESAWPAELYHEYVGHDTNRDWYAFTQVETQLTVEGAHNVWRPMIVHDVHQMGPTGARMFVPPYVEPVEPNIDPLLVSAINQLGSFMAAELAREGKTGVVTGSLFDLFSPSRAYSHYHGGVRILSETASAQLATRILLEPEDLTDDRGFRARERSINFPDPWPGGEWGLPEIVDYQETGVLALLKNAARNRRFWVDNFHRVQRRAVAGWDEWPAYWVIPAEQPNRTGLDAVLRILTMGMVEVHRAEVPISAGGRTFAAGSYVIPMRQPYAAWAQTLLEVQNYPDRRELSTGAPARPYDVTAHTLPLLMGIEAVAVPRNGMGPPPGLPLSPPIPRVEVSYLAPSFLRGPGAPRIGLYRGSRETIPAGWTRWLLDSHEVSYRALSDADLRAGRLNSRFDVIVFQDQSAGQISDGWRRGQMPPEFTGGVGSEGTAALRQFVQAGGRVVAIESATDFAISTFSLPVRSRTSMLPVSAFYIPGSILGLDVDVSHRIGRATPSRNIAWFGSYGRAFDTQSPAARIVARYAAGDPRLSGWALGTQHIAAQPAIVELPVGRGSVVLFGFQPNYRGQSIATWPLLFNAIGGR